jgi:hypothetical protein
MRNLGRFFLTALVALMLFAASSHKFPVTFNTPITSPQRLLVGDTGVPAPLPPPPPPLMAC